MLRNKLHVLLSILLYLYKLYVIYKAILLSLVLMQQRFWVFQVDPTVIGGMIIEIGDKHIDMSMATKIKNITNALRASV